MARIDACRSCGHPELHQVLDLGETPLADRLLSDAQLDQPEPVYPLNVVFCGECSLLQIDETVPPEVLFCQDYPYYSSISETLQRHTRENVLELIESRNLGENDLVVELASNDGYLLRNYLAAGVPVLGIDPADGPPGEAERIGVKTLNAFFTRDLALELVGRGTRADVIHANNVLAHVADTNGFVEGIAILLKDSGTVVIEVPYVRDLVDRCEFDTIYHEHLCYFSLTALDRLFRRHRLYLREVRHLSIHGGSLRLYLDKRPAPAPAVQSLLDYESREWVFNLDYYRDFGQGVARVKTGLRRMLYDLRASGKRIAAYGAAAKGSTLVNTVELGPDLIDFVVDRSPHKQGRYLPGQRLPVVAPGQLLETMPDYVLLLAWNFAEEIRDQQAQYEARGGRFIVPVPEPHILESRANG